MEIVRSAGSFQSSGSLHLPFQSYHRCICSSSSGGSGVHAASSCSRSLHFSDQSRRRSMHPDSRSGFLKKTTKFGRCRSYFLLLLLRRRDDDCYSTLRPHFVVKSRNESSSDGDLHSHLIQRTRYLFGSHVIHLWVWNQLILRIYFQSNSWESVEASHVDVRLFLNKI